MCDSINSVVKSQRADGVAMGTIYSITCQINYKPYVGQTRRPLEVRLREHRRNISKGHSVIEVAIQKYGWENFTVKVLEVCPIEMLNEREMYWIKKLNSKVPNGYNMTDGGDGLVGCTQETRDKMSANHADVKGEKNPRYGKSHSAETKAKISANHADIKGEKNPHYGKHHSEETKAKLSADKSGPNHPMYGKHHSEETIAKMVAARKAWWVRKKAIENGGES